MNQVNPVNPKNPRNPMDPKNHKNQVNQADQVNKGKQELCRSSNFMIDIKLISVISVNHLIILL